MEPCTKGWISDTFLCVEACYPRKVGDPSKGGDLSKGRPQALKIPVAELLLDKVLILSVLRVRTKIAASMVFNREEGRLSKKRRRL
ncbi:hypothetical protein HPP92_012179 [Vanilla planifolia]|uniref:Uncharacterized protein n=1 Tax=Vanilla planifolia TaxID=51239 RepID=A0A835R231_VANPL|nr:hypothetical protein HPP92_012179 [Vanilla planifolia]